MGKLATVGNSPNLYLLIRNIGPRKGSVCDVIEGSDSTLIHSQGRRLACWTELLREQFSWPVVTACVPRMPASKPMKVDISPPTEMEIIKKTDFPKRRKASIPDRPFPSFFRANDEILTSE